MGNRMLLAAIVGISLVGVAPAFAQSQVEKGATLFTAQKCSLCHSVAGKGNPKGVLDAPTSKLSAEDARQWLVAPEEMRTKTHAERKPFMKSFATLPKEDVDALVAYVLSLKKK